MKNEPEMSICRQSCIDNIAFQMAVRCTNTFSHFHQHRRLSSFVDEFSFVTLKPGISTVSLFDEDLCLYPYHNGLH